MEDIQTVLVAACNQAMCASVARIAEEQDLDVVGPANESIEAVQLAVASQPQIAVVGVCPPQPWSELCNYIRIASPACRIVLVLDSTDQSTLDEAMMLGVRCVIPSSNVDIELPRRIAALKGLDEAKGSEDYVRATDPVQTPRIIAVSGAKGGVGKTTFAANLAVALSQKDAGPVLIWDAYSQFGDIANTLSIAPSRLLSELADMKEDVDEEMVLSQTIRHEAGLDVLLTSDKPAPLNLLSESFVERVIRAVRKRYRFIVVDTPPIIHTYSTVVFARCWRLYLVTTLRDVVAISDAIKLIKALEGRRVRASSVHIVANRTCKNDTVKASEVESLMSADVIGSIPEDPSVSLANNRGKPISHVAPHCPAMKEIDRIAGVTIAAASQF